MMTDSKISSPAKASARVLYLVTAHKNPLQVGRLLKALCSASPHGEILLHYDPSGSDLGDSLRVDSPRVHLYPSPKVVRWGDFSLSDVFLEVTAWAIETLQFDWLVWISGQDYPLGPLDGFEKALAESGVDASFDHFSAIGYAAWPPREGQQRYFMRYYDLPSMTYWYRLPAMIRHGLSALRRWFNASQPFFVVRPQRLSIPSRIGVRRLCLPFTASCPCVGGSAWLNLNRRAIKVIHKSVEESPEFVAHYRQSHIPEESFCQTILVNSRELRVDSQPWRYVNWPNDSFSSHPAIITNGLSVEEAIASGMPFGRKFDIEVDSACLDRLDQRIARVQYPYAI